MVAVSLELRRWTGLRSMLSLLSQYWGRDSAFITGWRYLCRSSLPSPPPPPLTPFPPTSIVGWWWAAAVVLDSCVAQQSLTAMNTLLRGMVNFLLESSTLFVRDSVVIVKLHFGSRFWFWVWLCFRQIVSLPPTSWFKRLDDCCCNGGSCSNVLPRVLKNYNNNWHVYFLWFSMK